MKKIPLLLFCFSLFLPTQADAEIRTDGSLGGTIQDLSGQMLIPQSLGTVAGTNLFHSFSTFNINANETATFTSVDTFKNVISRVTGGNPSTIDGLLKSNIANANFYFINPAGVTFGANAQIDVPAAFYLSTADHLRFADNSQFSSSAVNASSLTVTEPIAFGFLDNQTGNITVQDSMLRFKDGSDVSLTARNLTLSNATLINTAGDIRIYATGNLSTELPVSATITTPLNGQISLTTNSQLDVSASSGGNIELQGADILISQSSLISDTHGLGDAGHITIAADNLEIANAGWVSSDTYAKGNAGHITINANQATINNAAIYSDANTNSSGNAGSVTVNGQKLSVLGFDGKITSDTYAGGNAGNIIINTQETVIDGGSIYSKARADSTGKAGTITITGNSLSLLHSGWIKSDTFSSGDAGNVNINAANITILNSGQISSSTSDAGNAGKVHINSENLTIDGTNSRFKTGIISQAEVGSTGKAGTIEIIAAGKVEVLNEGVITSSTFGNGDAGSVSVNSAETLINNGSIYTNAEADSTGNAGAVTINGQKLSVLGFGGKISSDTYAAGNAGSIVINAAETVINGGSIYSDANLHSTGNAGTITIIGNSLSLLNSGWITSNTFSTGKGGNVEVNTAHINIFSDGQISSSTANAGNAGTVHINSNSLSIDGTDSAFKTGIISQAKAGSTGKAGTIEITATEKVEVLNNGVITSSTFGDADAGTVTINSGLLKIANSGVVSSDTYAAGNAGNVNIKVDVLDIDGQNSDFFTGISSDALPDSSGNSGDLLITASEKIAILNQGEISSSTFAAGQAGNVMVSAPVIDINNAGIFATATANSSGQTGDIVMSANSLSMRNQSAINIKNEARVAHPNAITAGKIRISSVNIDLKNSHITAESINQSTNANVDAGDIAINFSGLLKMDSSFITTAANQGDGGEITIQNGELIHLYNSGFLTSVTEADGNGGNINVAAHTLVMNNGIIQANAVAGSGGDINLNLQALIPSQGLLIKGGLQLVWQPFIDGFNLIQAASATGVNGVINVSSPQFNISGSISGLDSENLVLPVIDNHRCQNSGWFTSSLLQGGKGGLPNNEAQQGFIPPETENINNRQKSDVVMPHSLSPIFSPKTETLPVKVLPCSPP